MTHEAEPRWSFCGIPGPHVVFAGPRTRAEFERLPLEPVVHDWVPDQDPVVAPRGDQRAWERRCTVKVLADAETGIDVIFQWFDYRLAERQGGDGEG
jgi:hypothetical protein